jgi:predicted MFS family arabinose efflux permease
VATGAALSVTHGTIARSARPHRLFAIVSTALGIFAVVFFGVTPHLIGTTVGPALFVVFSIVMAVAMLTCFVLFPTSSTATALQEDAPPIDPEPLAYMVWLGIAGIACMNVVQAMTFSFLERAGADRGFGASAVGGVLVALSVVNLLPGPLAALLEKRLPARNVLLAAPAVQAALAATIMTVSVFVPYAAAASVFTAVMIFAHTFAFGLLARLDPSGRALAATPAVLMTGSAIGPLLGGTLVKSFGYGSLGIAALASAALATCCFSRLPSRAAPDSLRSAVA